MEIVLEIISTLFQKILLNGDGDGYGDNRDWAPFDAEVWDQPTDYKFVIVGVVAVILVVVLSNTTRRHN